VTGTPWLDGLLTALSVASAALLLHATHSWRALLELAQTVVRAGLEPDLRWLWVAWLLALVLLARGVRSTA